MTTSTSTSTSKVSFYNSHAQEVRDALFLLSDESIENEHKAWVMFNVAGYDIILYVLDRNEVFFDVNGIFGKQDDMDPMIGALILRTLKREWIKIQKSLKGQQVYCCPYDEDCYGDQRRAMYQRMGFTEGAHGHMYLEC